MSILQIVKNEFNKRVFSECIVRIEKVLGTLSEDEVWYSPNAASNSVGHLILHLCGNVTQWIGTGIGKRPDIRKRDLEFSTMERHSKKELVQRLYALREITDEALATIGSEDILIESRRVQGYDETVLSILIHVTEHFSYHTGQIAIISKYLKGKDLGFYEGIDLNTTS